MDEVAVTREDDLETASAPEGGRWAFDEEVTAAFEDMLERSIPNYPDMRRFVTAAALWQMRQMMNPTMLPLVVDLGASRGSALAPIVDELGARARYGAIEVSPPMVAALEDRFKPWTGSDRMTIVNHDLREGFPLGIFPGSPAVVLSVLTMQFLPVEYRQQLLAGVFENLRRGGLFILVEKVLGSDARVQEMIVDIYHDHKESAGYSRDAIDRKRLALEGVLVPLTAKFNEELVRAAGFASVDCVWAWGSFRGWLCVKR